MKRILLFSFVLFLIVSCSSTLEISATNTLSPTITATFTQRTLSDASDLPIWIDQYVHAYDPYGGKIKVKGVEMDTIQLTEAIQKNPDAFTQVKQINGIEYSFAVVNGIPLAIKEGISNWQEATMGRLGGLIGVEFECSYRLDHGYYQEFLKIADKVFGKGSVLVLTTNLDVTSVFRDFSETDWQSVLDNWGLIQQDFSSGLVPSGFPYNWKRGQEAWDADIIRAFGGDPQYRSQQLYEYRLRPDGNIEALKQFQSQKSQKEMLKIFEFVVRARVLQFPEIKRWDVSDEVSAAYVVYRDDNHNANYNFWGIATGLTPAELTVKVAEWVKEDNPKAKTFITESDIFDTGNPVAPVENKYFFKTYIPEIIKQNSNRYIDGVIAENNWWIEEPQDWSEISKRIDYLISIGLEIGGSETMIVSGDTPINYCCGRKKHVQIQDRKQAQAEMFAEWLDLYLDKGIKTIGFGNIDDYNAWTQDVELFTANPTIFDIFFRAKPAYYSLVQVLYEHIP